MTSRHGASWGSGGRGFKSPLPDQPTPTPAPLPPAPPTSPSHPRQDFLRAQGVEIRTAVTPKIRNSV